MIIPYGIQTYRRAELPRIRLLNLYAESAPSSRAQTALITRPGMTVQATFGTGPIRGMFSQPGALGGALFVVSGTSLYKDGAAIGTIPGSGRVSMASSANQLLVANGAGLFASDGATVAAVEFPDDAGVTSVAYINGYFLASRANSQRFYWSGILDGESWDALDYASAERSPDNIVSLWIVSDQVWIFGEVTTEVWVTTGDGDVPFQRIDGRLYDQGCLARDSVGKLDNSVYWVGHDFKVYRGDTVPLRVSDHGIEDAIQASDPDTLTAWVFPWQGSLFYCLTTDSGTFAFNPASGQWNQFSSYGRESWRAHIGLFREGVVLAGDDADGRIWRLEERMLSDDGQAIERRWTALVDKPVFLDNLMVDASAGGSDSLTHDPLVEVRVSRDQGNTFGDWRSASTGKQGEYRRRIGWNRLGMIDGDGAVLDFRMTDQLLWRVASLRANESLAGRSRS